MYLLELLVSWLLKDRLKGLLRNFSSANLGLELRRGVLKLQDLALAPEAFATFGLPAGLAVKAAHAASLEVLLPWRQSPPGPLVLRCHGVRVVVGLIDRPPTAELEEWLHKQKMKQLKRTRSSAAGSSGKPPGPPLTTAQWQAAIDAMLRDLEVSLSDVVAVFEEGPGLPAVECSLRSLQIRCQRETTLPRLLSFCFARQFASLFSKCAAVPSDEHACRCDAL